MNLESEHLVFINSLLLFELLHWQAKSSTEKNQLWADKENVVRIIVICAFLPVLKDFYMDNYHSAMLNHVYNN